MKKTFFPLLQICLCILGYVCGASNDALAQVTSDDTVNTQVEQNGSTAEITGGETRGGNLFHSFQDFSVQTGNEAYFNNASDIANIFSRVTGGNISNIDGLIRANDSASLFLINPAGIVFGDNASLDLGGSFYGSTADSILFEGGEFSATDLDNPPLLTVNAPIGLGFRDEPGDIVNRSVVQNSAEESIGLEVDAGNTIALVGGELNFEAGRATAQGGNIYLGGLKQAGIVSFDRDGSLGFPEGVTLADLTLSNGGYIDVRGSGGGNIGIDAQNLTLKTIAGELTLSSIFGGIAASSTSADAQAGEIRINAVENISLNDGSGIVNQAVSGSTANAGKIAIATKNLNLSDGAVIDTSTFGTGNAGAINVTATGDVTIDGENSRLSSGIKSLVGSDAEGNSGAITIKTNNLNLTNGGLVNATTFGIGNAGAINIVATGDVTVDGADSIGLVSGIISGVDLDAVGDSGGIDILASNLNLTNGGVVSASTFSIGKAGAISITATGDVTIDGKDSPSLTSAIASEVNPNAEGDSGGIDISTSNLNLTNGGRVSASTFGIGKAGAISVTATGDVTVDGENSTGFVSSIVSQVTSNAEGDSGGISISTNNLNLTNSGEVDATTFGTGNAGNLVINAGSIFISGIEDDRIGITANAFTNDGDSGNIDLTTNQLTVSNNGIIAASNFAFVNDVDVVPGTGKPGSITINADNLELNNGTIGAATQFEGGQSGIINLQIAEDITLNNNSFISAQAFENADGGNLNIDARFIIAFPSNGIGNDLVATAERGTGGIIDLNTEQLFGLSAGRSIDRQTNSFISNNVNDLDVSGSVDGNLSITLRNIDPLQGTTELPETVVQTEQTSLQACQRRDRTAKSGLTVNSKGGVPPTPALPLDSLNITTNNQSDTISNIPAPIQTSQGKIQPARGIEVTKSGTVVLTAYHTNNAGDRLNQNKRNCE